MASIGSSSDTSSTAFSGAGTDLATSSANDEPKARRRLLSPRYQRWFDLTKLLVQRDLRIRYRGSVLGYIWSMMNPMLYMAILSFVFSHLLRFKVEHFSLFILSGILSWNLLQQSLVIGANSIIANGSLLRKVRVPAGLFPAASVCSVFVNFLLSLLPFFVVGISIGFKVPWTILLLPFCLLPYLAFIFGIALLVGSLNVRYRDIGHIMEPILMIAFYATPIVYPVDALPERYAHWLYLNPAAHFVGAVRDVMFYGRVPPLTNWLMMLGLAVISVAIGLFVYRRTKDSFVYYT